MAPENIYLLRWSGILLLAGGILFWIGAFWPPYKQWMTSDTREYLSIIHANRMAWYIIHICFALGVIVSLFGMQSMVNATLQLNANRLYTTLISTGYLLGSAFWLINIAFRLTVTQWAGQQLAINNLMPDSFQTWMDWSNLLFAIYMVLAYLSIALLGFILKDLSILPGFVGWFCIIFGLSGVLGYLIQFPLFAPPLMVHLPLMILGIFILIKIKVG
jgi:hypothetical protein